ncbi:MAG: hypothetical protein AAGK02_03175 [Pseudomonadota bacterium]
MDDGDLEINVSDELYDALKRQGKANGRTPDEEARAILIAALSPDTGHAPDADGSG